MKKFKKAAALGLSSMMALSSLVMPALAEETTAEADGLYTEVGTYPIVNEPIEMTVFCLGMPNVEDFNTNDFVKYMEEKTGIKLTFETGSRDDWQEKMNLMLQTDTYPDIFLYVGADQAKYGVEEGILQQLDDLIYDNMPNYVDQMGDYIDVTRQTDGHIYAIAGLNECYHCSYAKKMWVNTKYLDEMDVEVPTTTQEFYDVCQKFMETYPDKIAVAGANSGWYVRFDEWLMNSFTLVTGNQQGYRDNTVVDEDGKVLTVANTDEWKEGLKYLHSLYELGAIYDGDFTQNSEQLRTLMNQEDEPVLFVPYGTISDGLDADSNQEVYSHYECMAPLKGPEGVQLATFYKYSGLEENSFSITDHCKYPEAALRWVDFFFSETGDLCSQFGADEGTDWVLNPEGKTGLNGEAALYEVLNQYSSETQNHDLQDVCIRYAPATYRLGAATDPDVDVTTSAGLEKLLYDASKDCMEPYSQDNQKFKYDILPSLKFTSEEASSIATVGVEVENYIEECKTAFITGSMDIDSQWDEYVKGLEDCGLQTLLDVYQTAYDRQSQE